MSSIPARTRQNAPSHFMTISSLAGIVYAYNPTAGTTTFTNATWASAGSAYSAAGSPYLSSLVNPGGLLKDIGKNVVKTTDPNGSSYVYFAGYIKWNKGQLLYKFTLSSKKHENY